MGRNRKKKNSRVDPKSLKDYSLNKGNSSNINFKFLSKKNLLVIIVLLAIFLTFVFLAILVESEVISNPIKEIFARPQYHQIEDRCSLIVGKLIRTIESVDTCEMKCKAECTVRNLDFDSSVFDERENDCNSCGCYCK